MKVLVLGGGTTEERSCSLKSANAVSKALDELGYTHAFHDFKTVTHLLQAIELFQPTVIFNAMHGYFGEDGHIQAILDTVNIPYTHSSVLASSLAFHKPKSRILFELVEIPVPEWSLVSFKELIRFASCPYPFVAKPVNRGLSLGVSVIQGPEGLIELEHSWHYGTEIMVENYIHGREVTVAYLDGSLIGSVEITPMGDFYDYPSKVGERPTTHIAPAHLEHGGDATLLQYTERAFGILGCQGLVTCDFLYEGGVFHLLELNTNPPLHEHSPIGMMCKGRKFVELIQEMLLNTVQHSLNQSKALYGHATIA